MIGKLRREQKQEDNVEQVIRSIRHLMVESRHYNMDVFQLSDLLKKNGFSLSVKREPELPLGVPSLWFNQQGHFVILYRGFPDSLNVQLNILHELSHVLLGHPSFTKEDILRGKNIYTDSEEMEAELTGCQIFLLLNSIEYDNYVFYRRYPSTIINRNQKGHIFREVMDVEPPVMTEEEKKVARRMSEFFSL